MGVPVPDQRSGCDHSTGSGKALALAWMALRAAMNESVRETWEFWVGSERDLKRFVARLERNPAVSYGKREGRVLPRKTALDLPNNNTLQNRFKDLLRAQIGVAIPRDREVLDAKAWKEIKANGRPAAI
jgi:hypothetical protein